MIDQRSERATLTREVRTWAFSNVEVRSGDTGSVSIEGYAALVDQAYRVQDYLGEYDETFVRGAFKKSAAEADVRLLINHDGLPLARTKSGTLRLAEDSKGLHIAADLEPRSGMVSDVLVAMERGDVNQMSHAFQAVKQSWSDDYSARSITEARLFDVSVVTYPANPATSVGIRSMSLDDLSDDEVRDLLTRAEAEVARRAPAPKGRSAAHIRRLVALHDADQRAHRTA